MAHAQEGFELHLLAGCLLVKFFQKGELLVGTPNPRSTWQVGSLLRAPIGARLCIVAVPAPSRPGRQEGRLAPYWGACYLVAGHLLVLS